MVAVAVAEDDGADRQHARLCLDRVGEQLPTRRSGFLGQQGIDHDPPGLATNDRHHRQVIAAQLPDLVRHNLEQPVHRIEPRLPPQRRVDRVGGLGPVQEVIGAAIPDDPAILARDDAVRNFGNLAAQHIRLVARVVERQALGEFGLRGTGRLARRILRRRAARPQHDRNQTDRTLHRILPFWSCLRLVAWLGKRRPGGAGFARC